jgi:hypothetical protein
MEGGNISQRDMLVKQIKLRDKEIELQHGLLSKAASNIQTLLDRVAALEATNKELVIVSRELVALANIREIVSSRD